MVSTNFFFTQSDSICTGTPVHQLVSGWCWLLLLYRTNISTFSIIYPLLFAVNVVEVVLGQTGVVLELFCCLPLAALHIFGRGDLWSFVFAENNTILANMLIRPIVDSAKCTIYHIKGFIPI